MKLIHKTLGLLLAFSLTLSGAEALAQVFPSKPIKLLVGYPPGGATDTLARVVAQQMTERMGQPVIVENKAGANSIIAADYVAKSAPDGYTILVGGSGVMTFNPGVYKKLPYDTAKDFIAITQLGGYHMVFAVNPSVPAKTINELIALAKTKPGQLFYSAGATPFMVPAEMLKKQTGVDITLVPFKGSAQAITAAVADQVAMVAVDLPPAIPQIQAGKIRALAVSGPKRSAAMPDIPTMDEAGQHNFGMLFWQGLFVPAGTPNAVVDKLYHELSIILKQDSIKKKFADLGYETGGMGMPPAEFDALFRSELAKWTKVSRDLNIHVE